jgi:hypothetical protein
LAGISQRNSYYIITSETVIPINKKGMEVTAKKELKSKDVTAPVV